MPISIHEIYRDAADRRITWKEALQMTVVIDENGKVRKPGSESEKNLLEHKAEALRPYIKIANDPFLLDVAKILYKKEIQ